MERLFNRVVRDADVDIGEPGTSVPVRPPRLIGGGEISLFNRVFHILESGPAQVHRGEEIGIADVLDLLIKIDRIFAEIGSGRTKGLCKENEVTEADLPVEVQIETVVEGVVGPGRTIVPGKGDEVRKAHETVAVEVSGQTGPGCNVHQQDSRERGQAVPTRDSAGHSVFRCSRPFGVDGRANGWIG